MKKLLIFCLLIGLSFGCNLKRGNQKLFDEIYQNRAQIGDAIETVIELFGRPQSVTKSKSKKGGDETKVYVFYAMKSKVKLYNTAKSDAESLSIIVTVIKGKVTKIEKVKSVY